MKNQKGITLVALIITIIVMVILAGVIIVSAVADGGIIDRAQEAMKQKERGEIEDLIIASYEYKTGASGSNVYAYLDLNATAGNIWKNLTNNGFILKDESGNEYTSDTGFVEGQKGEDGTIDEIDINAEGKHGEYEGTVTEEGLKEDLEIVEESKNNPGDTSNNIVTPGDTTTPSDDEDIAFVERYLLGIDLEGRELEGENGIFDFSAGYKFIDDPTTPDEDETERGIEFLGFLGVNDLREEHMINFYMKYNSKVYRVGVDEDFKTMKNPGVEMVYAPQGREGEKIKVGEEDWTILYDNGTNVEAISPNILGNLTLGAKDTEAVGSTDLEKAIDSFNNAILRINKYCKDQIPDDIVSDENVRSVGASSETEKYLQEKDIPSRYTVGEDTWFKDFDNLIKLGEFNYEQDAVRMAYHNTAGNGDEFWVASRFNELADNGNYGRFSVIYLGGYGSMVCGNDWTGEFYINSTRADAGGGYGVTCGVRPIVKIEN